MSSLPSVVFFLFPFFLVEIKVDIRVFGFRLVGFKVCLGGGGSCGVDCVEELVEFVNCSWFVSGLGFI